LIDKYAPQGEETESFQN